MCYRIDGVFARIVSIIALWFITNGGCVPDPDGSLEGSPRGNLGMDDKLQLSSRDEDARRVMRPLVEYGPGFAKMEAQPFNHGHAVNKLKKLFQLKRKLYGKPKKSSPTKPPTTSKPSTTTSKPSTTTSKPSTTTRKPSTTTSKPTTTTSKPTTTTRKAATTTMTLSTTTKIKPSTTASKPSTTTWKPSTTKSKPSTTKSKPSTTTSKPKTIDKTSTPLKVIVNKKNKKQASRTRR